jgi:predicted secreted protein
MLYTYLILEAQIKEVEVNLMRGMGAIVFLVVFFVMLLVTLAMPSVPIGRQLYGLFGVPESNYPVLGIPVTTLVSAVLNGVFYGVIAWLVFTFGTWFNRRKST